MDFSLTPEQTLLQQNLQAFLDREYGADVRSATSRSGAAWDRMFWRRLAVELGLLGLVVPENAGGIGGGAVEVMLVMQAFGSTLVVEPFLESAVQATGLLRRIGGTTVDALLASMARGERVVVVAWNESADGSDPALVSCAAHLEDGIWRLTGHKIGVAAAPWADWFVVSARTSGGDRDFQGISLFLIDARAPGLQRKSYATIDGRWSSDLYLEGAAAELLGVAGQAAPLLAQMFDEAIAALAAEGLGIIWRMLDETVEYTRQRRQFGQALANFQALQHRMVDMLLQCEMAQCAVLRATLSLAASEAERAHACSAAKVAIARACRFVGQNAVQLHGAIGMTNELPLGAYFKRATVIERELGGVDAHLVRLARHEQAQAAHREGH
ncbi:acyl-CoA dehydrogenase family protein [Sinimarinibacterium thermocellulolyticum]|uniref:Acyl-CoA dehydrogenase family protein n=1 Tax=Sinimarinibacterium thermocellulolyticum TaxID=3170016 RepID=A0ABV2ADK5_9GAMM